MTKNLNHRQKLLLNLIKTKQNIEYIKDSWYEMGIEKFKDLNWKDEIKLFHLNDKELRSSLETFAESR